ncbi:MAG: MCP four helix bundle domain-containing protein, partial [Rhizobacter sp.]|nr:MCP four helix bundle domain-containing protein [Bacteriovorax sp.]
MKKYSLNTKLTFVLIIFIVSACTISFLGIYHMSKMNGSINSITEVVVPRMQNSYKVQGEFRQLAIRQSLLIMEDNKDEMVKIQEQMNESHEAIKGSLKTALEQASPERLPIWQKINSHVDQWWEKSLAIQKAAFENNDKLAKSINHESRSIRKEADLSLSEIVSGNEKFLKEESIAMSDSYTSAKLLMIIISVLSTIIATVIGFFVLKGASKAIQEVITSLNEGSIQVSSAAHQIAASSEELSQSSTEQASALEETAASIEEMNSMVAKNSDNAKSTAQMSGNSHDAALEGKTVVEKMISSMNMINQSN